MKKILGIMLILVLCIITFTGCYQDLVESSLDAYKQQISVSNCGFSSSSIDSPDRFLPTLTFLEDYEYIDGTYIWKEDDPFRGLFTNNVNPEIAFLCLMYDESVYIDAKDTMLENIKPDNKFYLYNDYVFYRNLNKVTNPYSGHFPKGSFAMACYNDKNRTLIFIGCSSVTLAGPSCLDQKYIDDIEGNWMDFIDQFYGEYYDFSK